MSEELTFTVLKQILPLLKNLKRAIQKDLITLLYKLNKAENNKNADLNLFFCRKCLKMIECEVSDNTWIETTCCRKKVTVSYKYKDLLHLRNSNI